MKTLTVSFILILSSLCTTSFADSIYLPPGSCLTIPSGSNICLDTIYVDTNACLLLGDSSVICQGTVLLGEGLIISVHNNSSGIPESFALYQNFPNPFNPTTTIRYEIPKLSFVTLRVYDLLGNEMTTLVSAEKPAGYYEIEFSATSRSASGGDALNLPSGIYFYKLQAGSFVETKKMVLLK